MYRNFGVNATRSISMEESKNVRENLRGQLEESALAFMLILNKIILK